MLCSSAGVTKCIGRVMACVDTRVREDFASDGCWMERCHIHDPNIACVDFGTICGPCGRIVGIGNTTAGFLGKWFWVGVGYARGSAGEVGRIKTDEESGMSPNPPSFPKCHPQPRRHSLAPASLAPIKHISPSSKGAGLAGSRGLSVGMRTCKWVREGGDWWGALGLSGLRHQSSRKLPRGCTTRGARACQLLRRSHQFNVATININNKTNKPWRDTLRESTRGILWRDPVGESPRGISRGDPPKGYPLSF